MVSDLRDRSREFRRRSGEDAESLDLRLRECPVVARVILGEDGMVVSAIAPVLPDGRTLGCFHILHIEDQPGRPFVENPRLDFEGRLRRFQSALQVNHGGLRLGAMHAPFTRARIHAAMAKMETIRRKLQTRMPLARIAAISLSAARRLSPIRMPTSMLARMLMVSVTGTMKKKTSVTLGKGALLGTTSSRICPRSRVNKTKVNTVTPIKA